VALAGGSSSKMVASLVGRPTSLSKRSPPVPNLRGSGNKAFLGRLGNNFELLCCDEKLAGEAPSTTRGETATPMSSGLMLFRQKLLLFCSAGGA